MQVTHGEKFRKELKKLQKKYRSLPQDLTVLERLILKCPTGDDSQHCNQLISEGEKCICKRRMMCRAVKGSEFRVIYYDDGETIELVYLEICYKGNKETEDTTRMETFWKEKTSGQ